MVVDNDAGIRGTGTGTSTGNGDTSEGGSASNGDDGGSGLGAARDAGSGVCVPNGITFKLDIGTTDDVWLTGSTPPWPAPSFGCPGWLTISAPVGSPWGNPQTVSVNVAKSGCLVECLASRPMPAAAQSFTWDGTYYPVATPPGALPSCASPACAPAGVYDATMCVGYAGADAGPQGAPTCQTFSFTWPPANPSEATVEATITPTLGGG